MVNNSVPAALSSSSGSVKGAVTIAVSASSNANITRTEFYQDSNITPFATVTAFAHNTNWDSTAVANGNHSIKIKIYFSDGRNTESNHSLMVAN